MRPENSNGFILLEVLVAMSLILGVWMASIGAYQGLALTEKEAEYIYPLVSGTRSVDRE
jgi:Tfp pilus assembly protein PilV